MILVNLYQTIIILSLKKHTQSSGGLVGMFSIQISLPWGMKTTYCNVIAYGHCCAMAIIEIVEPPQRRSVQ
jgi:hypothetical protein